MRFSLKASFTRLTLLLFTSVLLLSIAGRALTLSGSSVVCKDWPFCMTANPFGWLRLIHILLAGASAVIVMFLLYKVWREQRDNPLLLPLSTVTAVLFFGQAFVGAIQVIKNFPLHLVVLHTFTAILLWISMFAMIVTSGFVARDESGSTPLNFRQRINDFFILSKPLIVALLLLTTLGGLIVGGKGWPSPELAFWTMLGGALAASGSSALNQYIDRELDKKMQRTSNRPLAAGRMTAAEGLSFGP